MKQSGTHPTKPMAGTGNLVDIETFLANFTPEDLFKLPPATAEHFWKVFNSPNVEKPGETFASFFPDEAILGFRGVNNKPLRGGRRPFYWTRNRRGISLTRDEILGRQKHFLTNKTLPACRRKLADMLLSRSVLDGSRDKYIADCQEETRAFFVSIMTNLADEFKIDVIRADACIQKIAPKGSSSSNDTVRRPYAVD